MKEIMASIMDAKTYEEMYMSNIATNLQNPPRFHQGQY